MSQYITSYVASAQFKRKTVWDEIWTLCQSLTNGLKVSYINVNMLEVIFHLVPHISAVEWPGGGQ